MSETRRPLDLSTLEADYEIVGEANVRGSARTFMATRKDAEGKRRDDHSRVLITVVGTPEGDEGNALSHFAADAQLLARLTHRRLVPVIEGRWVDTEHFAVVTQRSGDTSLAALLARAERFSNPRVAAILRDVNGLLEWAREQRIVHRGVTAESVFLEAQADRVAASFVIAPISRRPISEPDADARTIARLAVAMLTRTEDPAALTATALGEARHDLPERVVQMTAALLDETVAGGAASVPAYLALIGMADPIAAEESELERIHSEIVEEQRSEREKLAAERAHFEKTMADERGRFATERADFLRAAEQEHSALAARREELETEARERLEEFERLAAQDRALIAELRANIQRAGELEIEKKRQATLDDIAETDNEITELDQNELATPPFVLPPMLPLKELVFEGDRPWAEDPEEAVPDTRDYATAEAMTAAGTGRALALPARRRIRVIPLAIAGAVVISAISAVAINRYSADAPVPTRAVAAVPAAVPVSAPASAAPLPVGPGAADSSGASSRQVADTLTAAAQLATDEGRVLRDSLSPADSVARADSLRRVRVARLRRDARKRDSLAHLDSIAPPDTFRLRN